MAKTLFQVWNEHVQDGTCSKKFSDWCTFRAYCAKNNLKVEDFADVKDLTEPKPKPEQKVKPNTANGTTTPAVAAESD